MCIRIADSAEGWGATHHVTVLCPVPEDVVLVEFGLLGAGCSGDVQCSTELIMECGCDLGARSFQSMAVVQTASLQLAAPVLPTAMRQAASL